MGIGKVLPTLVILSISAMMVFSLLPVYAHNPGSSHGHCTGQWEGPFTIAFVDDKTGESNISKDKNENGFLCIKLGGKDGLQVKDDNPIKGA